VSVPTSVQQSLESTVTNSSNSIQRCAAARADSRRIGVTIAGQRNKARVGRVRGAGGHAPIGRWNVRHMRHPIVVVSHGFSLTVMPGGQIGPLQPISSHDPPATHSGKPRHNDASLHRTCHATARQTSTIAYNHRAGTVNTDTRSLHCLLYIAQPLHHSLLRANSPSSVSVSARASVQY
jgi:hypothetical protein